MSEIKEDGLEWLGFLFWDKPRWISESHKPVKIEEIQPLQLGEGILKTALEHDHLIIVPKCSNHHVEEEE